ncbi:MAG: hypothetical protein IJW22_02515, partial [Clostridia bacterium]|nr:hypothetical protein [Clostridia bacterium]
MQYFPYLSRPGELTELPTSFSEALFLLNDAGKILEGRTAQGEAMPEGSVFDTVAPLMEDAADFRTAKYGVDGAPILTLLSGKPALFVRSFVARTGRLLLAMPEGEVGRVLSAPGAYADSFTPAILTKRALVAFRAPLTEDYQLADSWLRNFFSRFEIEEELEQSSDVTLSLLIAHVRKIATAVGVRAHYDFSGLEYAPLRERVDWGLLDGFLYTLFLTARRIAKDMVVELGGEPRFEDGPMIYARMYSTSPAPCLHALERMRNEELARDNVFELVRGEDGSIIVLCALSYKEFSAQGVK